MAKTKRLSFAATETERELIEKAAADQHTTISELIRVAVLEQVELFYQVRELERSSVLQELRDKFPGLASEDIVRLLRVL